MTTNPTNIFIAIAFALLLLTTTPSSVKAVSSGCELVRSQRLETQQQNTTAPEKTTTSDPLPAADKIWTIGVLLPITGEYATIGQRFHRGLKLALAADPTSNQHKWQLVLLDSAKITPGTAVKQLKDNHATVILGPIQSRLAQPAAKEAAARRLPIILMAPQPQLTNLNENVFQHFLSATNQAREMARFLQQKDEKKVGLLHPDNDFGNDFKNSFTNSCRNEKITIVKSGTYNPHATDFSSAIKNLQDSTDPATEPQTTIPSYPFTALVIADFYPRLRLLAPQLTFNNLGDCQLYGTRGGNDQRLEKEAEADLEGAIFLDLGLTLPKAPQTATDYRKRYLKTYQERASIYDAYAYDSITILNQARRLISSAKATNLSEALLNLPPLKLVTGLTTVSPTGEFSKQLYPIVFKNKKRRNLNETAPNTNK
ncbi:MAG: penicillin-binding protein activator [Pseudomonadota bacterium]|nr:penicillin-binding protein activator [Pseudomonadota bacterium]